MRKIYLTSALTSRPYVCNSYYRKRKRNANKNDTRVKNVKRTKENVIFYNFNKFTRYLPYTVIREMKKIRQGNFHQ